MLLNRLLRAASACGSTLLRAASSLVPRTHALNLHQLRKSTGTALALREGTLVKMAAFEVEVPAALEGSGSAAESEHKEGSGVWQKTFHWRGGRAISTAWLAAAPFTGLLIFLLLLCMFIQPPEISKQGHFVVPLRCLWRCVPVVCSPLGPSHTDTQVASLRGAKKSLRAVERGGGTTRGYVQCGTTLDGDGAAA